MGDNSRGHLGDGTVSIFGRITPIEIDPADLSSIVAVAASDYSNYALSSDGSLWVWGNNTFGALGLGTNTSRYLTQQHLLPPTGYMFTSIDAGGDAHAVAALRAAQ